MADSGDLVRMVRLRDEQEFIGSGSMLLKMDIEGAEADVLPDILPSIPFCSSVHIETHFARVDAEALLAPLGASGFSICRLRERTETNTGATYIDWILSRG